MEINFHQNKNLSEHEIKVQVSAKHLSPDVLSFLNHLEHFENHFSILPINADDRTVLLSLDDVITIEVLKNKLTIYAVKQNYETHGQLKQMIAKINDDRFVQISKNSIINIDHLNYMEAAFSGNMTAFLDRGVKTNVSRKYLPKLKEKLKI
ncbi:transcriptional regulator [Philodulcilactobacillus myokoensis]|uniref:Transcriptional regulator n=1 Tax=Philodulcilactobacillus myokoensis TaxID=2929573 RepID=A0A9W6B1M6_9LACO|nr:LytTR family DNA-binding domain-containing protein [Philodulcilactobacillus myokoensis]GLB46469.1 transcriptional regulator [Philodulcilactobacillus myokoensis]